MSEAGERIRIDRWLFFARVTKSRTLAKTLVEGGGLRLDGERMTHPARLVGPGNVVTVNAPKGVVVLRILACGTRRGPAGEARLLYEDLTEPPPSPDAAPAPSGPVAGPRPDKRERSLARHMKRHQSFHAPRKPLQGGEL
ncbi:MAG: RNA-binding S4 domain-containing protein [Hyphomicrobiaceae bacterium]|nr:RNA-binding S4 domain-containing protein [Hyphomicrobiaceae bacterium]